MKIRAGLAHLCIGVAALGLFAAAAVDADSLVDFSGGQVLRMDYASDPMSIGGTFDYLITNIKSGYGTTGYLNLAADLDRSGSVSPNEWLVQNSPMYVDSGLTSEPLSIWFNPEAHPSLQPGYAYQTYVTMEDHEIPNAGGYAAWHFNATPAGQYLWGGLDPQGQYGTGTPPAGTSTAGNAASPLRKGVPDIKQKKNECGPTSAANSLRWLAKKHGFNNKLPPANDDLILDLMKAMTGSNVRPFGGLMWNQLYDGKLKYIKEKTLPLIVRGGNKDDKARGGKAFDFIKSEYDKGEDIEFLIDRPGTTTSHWVTVVGYAVKGDKLYLDVHDPDDGKKGAVRWELKRNGDFVNPKGKMLWAVSESIPEPASLSLLALGALALLRRRRARC